MNIAVLDAGFGDSGKGLVTDVLCNQFYKPLVARFSGGHQVTHSVVKNGYKHVFGHFGAGTLSGVPTYWSKYCTVFPLMLLNELDTLKAKGFNPKIFIDPEAPVTTPYEIAHNQNTPRFMKDGTCGLGYGSTIIREEAFYHLTFLDLFYPEILKAKLAAIGAWYKITIQKEDLDNFLEDCDLITKIPEHIQCQALHSLYNYTIFEGSQGLLLDQHHGFFPNVTRSNTGTKNILEMVDLLDKVILVTRSYQTRHGNGFMTNEDKPHNIKADPNETNITNQFQGVFRRTLLDLDLLQYAIAKDPYLAKNKAKCELVITCLDHSACDYRFTVGGNVVICADRQEFIQKISEILNIKIYGWSDSPETKDFHFNT